MNPFTNIEIRELPTLLKVMKNEGMTAKEITTDLVLIDDLLTLQKTKSLLNRKRGLKEIIDARIGLEFGITPKNMNRK